MKMAMEGEGNHEEYIQVVLIPLAHEHNPDKFVNQAEGSSSSSITAENQRLDNALFDRSENINNDESGLTEPTSICIEDAIGNIQETRMQNFNIVDQCSADEKAQLLSDLNIHYDPTKSSLSDATRKNEDPEDGDEGLNLDEVEVPPRNVVTTALNDFVSAEATHGRPTGVVAETGATGFCCNTEEFSLGSVEDAQLGWHVDVSYVKKSLMKAACEWNRRIAAVQFVPVADTVPAVFQLTYRHADDGRGTLARAFIPRYPDTLEMLQKLFVYPLVFKKKHYPHMTHIFCHELGHILDRSAA
ncbi:putative peptidase m10 metallopeptidase protein [Eutypa lata UCREL1]|uniref:Putative peptidase m10 metallopeptidase protein n=1 Tax=Eutypa lata (strain UCR-EL1) TaxID=1287681 RepID=M7TBL7_EUTLA|nr:putative peptidase m10 metallopeptidase protein [Eutypa lata UCREL1]